MGERVGRIWQGVALFAVGVLVGAVLLGGIALPGITGESVEAQGSATWQVQQFNTPVRPDSARIVEIQDWVESLPAECDLVASPNFNWYFYRCP